MKNGELKKVKDIASHLLQTGAARLSGQRDGRPTGGAGGPAANDFAAVARLVGRNNDAGEAFSRKFSPRLVTEPLVVTEPELARFLRTLDPRGPAFHAVAWAGESASANWFDVARECTERWHHQEQIREAVGASLLTDRRWLGPVIDILMRAAPFWYAGHGGRVASRGESRRQVAPPQGSFGLAIIPRRVRAASRGCRRPLG